MLHRVTARDLFVSGARKLVGARPAAAMPANPPNRSGFSNPPGYSEPSDCGFAAWTYDPIQCLTTALLTTGGRMQLARINMPGPMQITNVFQNMSTAGAALTAGQCFVCVYDQGFNLIGQSASLDGLWTGATGLLTIPLVASALAGPPFIIDTPVAYVGAYFNGTTSPTLRCCNLTTAAGTNGPVGVTAGRAALADSGLTTAPPARVNPAALSLPYFWAALN